MKQGFLAKQQTCEYFFVVVKKAVMAASSSLISLNSFFAVHLPSPLLGFLAVRLDHILAF